MALVNFCFKTVLPSSIMYQFTAVDWLCLGWSACRIRGVVVQTQVEIPQQIIGQQSGPASSHQSRETGP